MATELLISYANEVRLGELGEQVVAWHAPKPQQHERVGIEQPRRLRQHGQDVGTRLHPGPAGAGAVDLGREQLDARLFRVLDQVRGQVAGQEGLMADEGSAQVELSFHPQIGSGLDLLSEQLAQDHLLHIRGVGHHNKDDVGIRGDVSGQHLQRDFAIQARVLSQVDFTHTSRAEKRANFVASELCFGSKGHEELLFYRQIK